MVREKSSPDGAVRHDGDVPAAAHRRHRRVLVIELALIGIALLFTLHEAPGFASSVGDGFRRLGHPQLGGLGLAVVCEVVSILALAHIPRWLLATAGVPLGRLEAVVLGVAANGMAVVLPAGTVSSSVWVAHQYNRRGARAGVATWVVLAAGFCSSVTLIAILIVGAAVDRVADLAVLAAVMIVFVAGVAAFVVLVHKAERMPSVRLAEGASWPRRALSRVGATVRDTAGQRAGWSTGSAVLAASAVNWLADAGCLASAFLVLRMPVPWRALLLAYAAGQLAGALVPLPAGLGAVEGGMVGVLVGAGLAAGPAIAVVAVYRLLGYWAPSVASVPAYGWARRRIDPPASEREAESAVVRA